MKRVKGPSDVPVGPHYCVIIYGTSSVYIEGDQRSRDCPGHGYPAHTEVYDSFEHWVTESLDELNAFVDELEKMKSNHLSSGKEPYVVLGVQGKAKVRSEVKVNF